MRVQERLSRIVDHDLVEPPSMPMEFWVRSYGRVVWMPLPHRDWDGGQIASQALDELDSPAVE